MELFDNIEDILTKGYLTHEQKRIFISVIKEIMINQEAVLVDSGNIVHEWEKEIVETFLEGVGYYGISSRDRIELKYNRDYLWIWEEVDACLYDVLEQEFYRYKGYQSSDAHYFEYYISVESDLGWPEADYSFIAEINQYLDRIH